MSKRDVCPIASPILSTAKCNESFSLKDYALVVHVET